MSSETPTHTLIDPSFSRTEKRKALKKLKRKQLRKEVAEKERLELEALLNDPEEQKRLLEKEREEKEENERQRRLYEERERVWMERIAKEANEKRRREEVEEEEELRKIQVENGYPSNEDDEWDYVEEGPAEIIWQGNEIIVKKNKIKVPKRIEQQPKNEDLGRPTSNPLPPQSEEYASHRNASGSTQQVYETFAQQTPNFGTEQDKSHCPFHIKTGVCRFGQRCSRVHLYPDHSCTLLIKNMYNGPGLACEQDEGLECTDEEVERCYEEFYEDVHTEFLKFGEIVNFKVCKNSSSHLRGNVYVHYTSLESASVAYRAINGRFFAGKQISCEFVGVTRWKIAICGEYIRSKLKGCSRGTACNFIHCFRNPGGDYEWADWDKPPPKYWVKEMATLFGSSHVIEYHKDTDREGFGHTILDRYHSRRSRSRDFDYLDKTPGRDSSDESRSQRDSTLSRRSESYMNMKRKRRRSSNENGHSEYSSGSEKNQYERNRELHSDRERSKSRSSKSSSTQCSKWKYNRDSLEKPEKDRNPRYSEKSERHDRWETRELLDDKETPKSSHNQKHRTKSHKHEREYSDEEPQPIENQESYYKRKKSQPAHSLDDNETLERSRYYKDTETNKERSNRRKRINSREVRENFDEEPESRGNEEAYYQRIKSKPANTSDDNESYQREHDQKSQDINKERSNRRKRMKNHEEQTYFSDENKESIENREMYHKKNRM